MIIPDPKGTRLRRARNMAAYEEVAFPVERWRDNATRDDKIWQNNQKKGIEGSVSSLVAVLPPLVTPCMEPLDSLAHSQFQRSISQFQDATTLEAMRRALWDALQVRLDLSREHNATACGPKS